MTKVNSAVTNYTNRTYKLKRKWKKEICNEHTDYDSSSKLAVATKGVYKERCS